MRVMAMSGLVPDKSPYYPEIIKYLQRLAMKLGTNAGQLGRLPLCLIVGLYLVPGAVGQQYWEWDSGHSYKGYNCDKYCFANCQMESQFTACVNANLKCSCATKITLKNPFFMFGLFVGCVLLFSICSFCFKYCGSEIQDNRRRSHRIVALPVTGMPGSGAHIIANSRANNSHTRSSQTSPRPFVIPLGGSQKSNDLPPEYLPPPSYNDCVVNVESTASPKY